MKKEYSTPIAEKIAFNYRDQVVAASGVNAGTGGQQKEQVLASSDFCRFVEEAVDSILGEDYVCNWLS